MIECNRSSWTSIIAVMAVLPLSGGACSIRGGPAATATVTALPTATPTLTVVPSPTAIPTPTPLSYHTIGEKFVLPNAGFAIQIAEYNPRATLPIDPFLPGDTDKTFSSIGVAACAFSTNSGSLLFNTPNFALEMTDHSRWSATRFPAAEPDVGQAYLAPGHCVSGYVTFKFPPNVTPAFIVFTILSTGEVVRWKLP